MARFVHLEKAADPMLITVSGMKISVNPVQPEKAESPMEVTPTPIETVFKNAQKANA